MEHHLVKHIREKIEEAKNKIRNLQRTVKIVESRTPVLATSALIDEAGQVRRGDILPMIDEFRKLLAEEKLLDLHDLFKQVIRHLDEIDAVLKAIATRYIPNKNEVNSAVTQILNSSSEVISALEKLYTFIDFSVEKNTIQLIKDRIQRIRLFALAIRQHAQLLIGGYRKLNQENITDGEQWVVKLDRFRLENIEPLKDKFNHLFSEKLAGELGQYTETIRNDILAIERIYKSSPLYNKELEEAYEREVFQHLDIIDHTVGQMERFVNKYVE